MTAREDAEVLRAAAKVFAEYGVAASANVANVVANAIENGTRTKVSEGGTTVVYPGPPDKDARPPGGDWRRVVEELERQTGERHL